jgi:hypothetical protein
VRYWLKFYCFEMISYSSLLLLLVISH